MARLDAELVRRGLAKSRSRACELVDAGRVHVDATIARKPSQQVTSDAHVVVDDLPGERVYVSRAALKLVGAFDALASIGATPPDPAGARCLDAGASTGGFTQVLLERGASLVYAVDVGHGQMSPEVLADPRVILREGVNVRALPADVAGVNLVVADLSFISLTMVMDALLSVVDGSGDLLLMVKPQFEVGRERLGASGVVSSPLLRTEAVLGVVTSALGRGAVFRGVIPSPVPGPAGNREYFVWLHPGARPGEAIAPGVADSVVESVRCAVHDGVTVVVEGRRLPA